MTRKRKKEQKNNQQTDNDIEIIEEKENIEKYKKRKSQEKQGEEKKSQKKTKNASENDKDELVEITGEELRELEEHVEKAMEFKQTLQQIQEEAEVYRDQLMRLQAEFDNYRKRILREKENIEKYALETFFKNLIPVYDNFLHALNAVENARDIESIKEGVEYIFKSFSDLLQKNGFEKIDAVGVKFDPNYHDAVLYEEVEGAQPMEVVEELQPGYIYKNKVIKPALVKVAK